MDEEMTVLLVKMDYITVHAIFLYKAIKLNTANV